MLKKTLPGLLLAGALALAALHASEMPLLQSADLSALSLAIILGMLVGNTLYRRIAGFCDDGVVFAKQTVLRLGIILFGFKLTLNDIASVGWAGAGIDLMTLSSTFLLACWIGHKCLGMDRQSVILIGAGSSICGAAAVLATETMVKSDTDKVAVAVATVVVFGTVAMFLWPAGYAMLRDYGISEHQFGVFAGSTLHEVAQVAAAGRAVGDEAMDAAVITKMIRVMLLAPFLMLLSAWLSSSAEAESGRAAGQSPIVPWFAIFFVLVVAANSLSLLSPAATRLLVRCDDFLLALAMAALGIATRFSAIRRAGVRPLWLAFLLLVWLILGGGAINAAVNWMAA